MQTPTLGEACFPSPIGHKVSDDIRIPERIVPGADPGLLFELVGPREKLFFNPSPPTPALLPTPTAPPP